MKRLVSLFLVLMLVLTACGSDYSDASVDIPSTWATYTVDNVTFRFEAGYKESTWNTLQADMDLQTQVIGTNNTLALFGRLASPPSGKGTVNYIDFGYWDMGHEFQTVELEGIMETLNDLALPIKKTSTNTEDGQSARIRSYNDLEALTLSYTIQKDTASCLMQIALVPHGARLYLISYADFSTGADNDLLEGLLSTLSFRE